MVSDSATPQRIARLTPLADVLARIDALVQPVEPRSAELSTALGRTLAEDVVVDAAIPAAALALCDGWAVASELTTDAGAYAPAPLPAAVRVDVGETLPSDADAVAPLDAVTVRNGAALALTPVGPGDGVLPAAADIARGATLLEAGRRLGRAQVALLAAAGVAGVRIREPRLRLVPARAGNDAVIDAAKGLVVGDIGAYGGVAISNDDLESALADQGVDAVIAIGGTGTGRNDASVCTLARLGRIEAHGIALSPGETAAVGFAGSRPVLLLPGRLDAALAVWLVIGRHLLARLCGSSEEEPATKAMLCRKVASTLGLAEMIPVRVRDGAAEPIASGYVPLSALARANGWILVKPESEGYPAGSEVVIRPWP